jgi:hypothetical protein
VKLAASCFKSRFNDEAGYVRASCVDRFDGAERVSSALATCQAWNDACVTNCNESSF